MNWGHKDVSVRMEYKPLARIFKWLLNLGASRPPGPDFQRCQAPTDFRTSMGHPKLVGPFGNLVFKAQDPLRAADDSVIVVIMTVDFSRLTTLLTAEFCIRHAT